MNLSVRETEIAQGDAVGTLEATLSGTVTWSCADLPAVFALAADTGALTLAAEKIRAYQAAFYTFTATADNGTDTEDVAVTVTVQDWIDYAAPAPLAYDYDLKSMAGPGRTEALQAITEQLGAYMLQRGYMATNMAGYTARDARVHFPRRALHASGVADILRPYLRVGGVEAG